MQCLRSLSGKTVTSKHFLLGKCRKIHTALAVVDREVCALVCRQLKEILREKMAVNEREAKLFVN